MHARTRTRQASQHPQVKEILVIVCKMLSFLVFVSNKPSAQADRHKANIVQTSSYCISSWMVKIAVPKPT